MRRLKLSVIALSGFLLLASPMSTLAQGTRLTQDGIDSLLGSQSTFDRGEVVDLLVAVVGIADEEITRTSEEAVKAVVLEVAPALARERMIAEEWRRDAERGQTETKILKGAVVIEAICIGVLGVILGVRGATR